MKDPGLFAKLIHADDPAAYNLTWQQLSENDLSSVIELRISRNDLEIRWIHSLITKIYDDQGKYTGFRSSTTDITETFNIRNNLEISEARYKAMVECRSELIIRHKLDITIILDNEAITSFNGI